MRYRRALNCLWLCVWLNFGGAILWGGEECRKVVQRTKMPIVANRYDDGEGEKPQKNALDMTRPGKKTGKAGRVFAGSRKNSTSSTGEFLQKNHPASASSLPPNRECARTSRLNLNLM